MRARALRSDPQPRERRALASWVRDASATIGSAAALRDMLGPWPRHPPARRPRSQRSLCVVAALYGITRQRPKRA
jgi:hypothetical protein